MRLLLPVVPGDVMADSFLKPVSGEKQGGIEQHGK
jgi:hypothetical protein